jgi:hypothetical protein
MLEYAGGYFSEILLSVALDTLNRGAHLTEDAFKCINVNLLGW